MADEELLFNPHDEPVFNTFDLPVVCNNSESEDPCCDVCTDWLHCFHRSLYRLESDGFNFDDLVNWLTLTAGTQIRMNQNAAFTDGDGVEFSGSFIAIPPSQFLVSQQCESLYGGGCPDQHKVLAHRTITSPTAVKPLPPPKTGFDISKDVYLSVATECVLNDEDEKCVQFTVNISIETETPQPVYEPAIVRTADFECDAWVDNPEEPCPEGVEPEEWCECNERAATPYVAPEDPDVGVICCPILRSAKIPLAGLTSLTDLADVPLYPIPKFEVEPRAICEFEGDDYQCWKTKQANCLQTSATWPTNSTIEILTPVCVEESASRDEVTGCCYFEVINPPIGFVEGMFYDSGDYPGAHALNPWEGSTIDLDVECIDCYAGSFCNQQYNVAPPMVYLGPTYTLTVLNRDCSLTSGCGTCIKEGTREAVEVEVYISGADGTSCVKTLTVNYPDCLDVEESNIIWSDGQTGKTISYRVRNQDPETTGGKRDDVSVIVLDNRGCLYCARTTLTCGCCAGVSGSLSIAVDRESACKVTVTANVTSTEDCPQARIEILGGNLCPSFGELDGVCTCEEMFDGEEHDPPCVYYASCAFSLGNGQSFQFTLDNPPETISWRVVDGPCGCGSDWVQQTLTCTWCECCSTPLTGALLIITGTGQGELPGCLDCDLKIDGAYFVPLQDCGNNKNFVAHFQCEAEGSVPETVTVGVFVTCQDVVIEGIHYDAVIIDAFITAPSLSQVDFQRVILYPAGTFPIDCAEELDGFLTNLAFGAGPWEAPCSGSGMSMEIHFTH